MVEYVCDCCDYHTPLKQNFKRHNTGPRHFKKVKECKKYACQYCGIVFDTRKRKWTHEKICEEKTEYVDPPEENKDMTTGELFGMFKEYQQQMNSVIGIAKDNTKVAQATVETSLENAKNVGKSMNMMKYAMVHFKDAPPLLSLDQNQVFEMLEYDQIKVKEPNKPVKPKDEVNDEYITQVLYNYENKAMDSFFGNFIVNFFNTEEMKDRKFWTSDVSRLSFIIMQVVNREGEREWNHDKTGKKFVDLVIDPMFDEVVKLLDEFVNNKQKWIDENFGKVYISPSRMTHLMHVQQLAKELQIDIKYGKFTKDILKFVAPNFNFDTVRLVELQKAEQDKLNKINTELLNKAMSSKPLKVVKPNIKVQKKINKMFFKMHILL
jgi:hypothetical protein